jgi:hypothetical protein
LFEKESDIIMKVFSIYVDSVGVSLMMRNQQRMIEANYIYFKNIEFGVMEKVTHRSF